jgi:ankyrin repeat protein
MTAARTGKVDALKVLLEHGADLNARERWFGETALIWAAAENHAGAVRLLIERGADVNSRSALQKIEKRRTGQSILSLGSWTPLMYAARENAIEAGQALVSAHADLNLVDPDGASALVVAIINANYEFAALLIDAGADPNVVDKEAAMGPLYAAIDMHRLAIGHGRPNPRASGTLDAVAIVRRLLDRKADANARLIAPIFQRHHTMGDGALGKGATPW